ncbi:MAG: isoaspartyl peptidase/L-asparaginase [Myxococcales bacterium]|nr:isoaspartyl peptidase/L-asparaginase [Myxococcales bacterium]MCB9578583.1 isoaspartyl peptidase/L-asparaginase [Polyangiaceae bacterium]
MAALALDCRVRRDEPEGPSAESVIAPAASFAHGLPRRVVPEAGVDASAPLPDAGEPPKGTAVVAFGGLDSAPDQPKPEQGAVRVAMNFLARGGAALDAAVEGARVLEDSPRRNAGTGSALRLDGTSIEMDAAVMASDGRAGAVAAISRVKNPVRVARRVADTSYRVLSGDGAYRFAELSGEKPFDPILPDSHQRYRALLLGMLSPDGGVDAGLPADWERWVNPVTLERLKKRAGPALERAPPGDGGTDAAAEPAEGGSDTVAVLVRGVDGEFAGAVSSGGPWLALPGRVGDVPVAGAALWVGERGAVAATGDGEAITRAVLAKAVYDRLVALRSAKLAVQWGQKQVPGVGLAVIDARNIVVEPAQGMAWADIDDGERTSAEGGKP